MAYSAAIVEQVNSAVFVAPDFEGIAADIAVMPIDSLAALPFNDIF